MSGDIAAGTLWIEDGIRLPNSLSLQNQPHANGWTEVDGARAAFEKEIHEAGWTFFFMAGEIKSTVFGFDRQKNLRNALRRLATQAKSHNCNGIEITQVTGKSFFKVPYVSVSAHARHLQKGLVFSGQPLNLNGG
jgi:hypothetical protein